MEVVRSGIENEPSLMGLAMGRLRASSSNVGAPAVAIERTYSVAATSGRGTYTM
jgi:hypothetical protein